MSHQLKLALGISAIVVFCLGFLVYFGILIKVRLIRKKYIHQDEQKLLMQLQQIRDDLGTLPYTLKEAFGSKAQDWDIEFLINTIYLNNYQNVLLVSKYDNFVFAAISEKTKKSLFYLPDYFNGLNWNETVEKFPTQFHHQPKIYSQQDLDCAIFYDGFNSNLEIFNNYYQKLNDNGLLIINQKNIPSKELKLFIATLKEKQIKWEIVFYKQKYLYIKK
ncbi:hypothetical protein V2E24_01040 [Mycoplasmopsis ciconiae]|uniref:Uncharacterized protein n=1 Tax=Mycoplasmopsis ciconiae TaxID=561067 RepID=A0ABU7ML31_9BACT|nr:hypothetical protein [Mycoplasmopsis ciconiae]